MVHTPVDIEQVKHLAATGHFRSIALWLNYPLVPQAIYAHVQADQYPGYLRVLLEFERPPKQDALIRLVCNRLCRLESETIRGVCLVGRLIGTEQPLWQQRIRLAQRKKQVPHTKAATVAPSGVIPREAASRSVPASVDRANSAEQEPIIAVAETITTTTYGSTPLKAVPSYLIPRESEHSDRRRRPNRSAAPSPVVHIRSATVDSTQTPAQRRVNRRRFAPKEMVEEQFKYMRAIVVTGSAAAAFILGCVTETILFQRAQLARKQEPTLPTFNNDVNQGNWPDLNDIDAQEISYRSSPQSSPRAVPAALETVAVMPHDSGGDSADPTVTLVFGGAVTVGDVPLQTPDAVDQVLGDLELFREADVAMVGLGNSLANADTSLQENYFDRTRTDAVDALNKGGIDIVGLTSDRTMEFGRQGLTETLNALDGAGIYRVGAGLDRKEARRPEVLDVKGQRIAYLSYAPNSDDVATLSRAGLNIQEREDIIQDIAALRQAVDWIVVNYRWDGDLDIEPNAQQVNLSRSAIDAGADLVVGYHAQKLQGAELYKSRPIVYALGDFIFQDEPLADHDTATVRVSLREQQMKVEFLPISVRDARPKAASGKTAKAILKQIRQASEPLSSPLQFPAVLDAAPKSGASLLKPDKPTPPVKSLGELEPGPLDRPNYGELKPGPLDGLHYGQEEWTPEPYRFESDAWEANDVDTGNDAMVPMAPPVDPFDEPLELEVDGVPGSLESFDIQPDHLDVDGTDPGEGWEPTVPVMESQGDDVNHHAAPKALPDSYLEQHTYPDDVLDGPNELGIDVVPEPNEDILVPEDQQPLPGYDALDDWGEKASPHEEFNPIQQRLNSLEPVELESSGHSAVSVGDSAEEPTDAISPHDEPLVGPLSQQLPRQSEDTHG